MALLRKYGRSGCMENMVPTSVKPEIAMGYIMKEQVEACSFLS